MSLLLMDGGDNKLGVICDLFLSICLQSPFNKKTYRIIGDNKAPTYFQINSESGDITLNSSLEADAESYYTVSGPSQKKE